MKALVKQIGIQFGVTFLALALLLTLGAPLLQSLPGQVSQPLQETVIRLGFAGTAEAITPDTTFTGSGDDLKIQAAVDALPATGGRIIIGPGNITFTTTVSRAINNITIEGSGKATYFANNGATALFSAGAQTGWVFRNFRTDAGYLTLGTTTIVDHVWNNTAVVAPGTAIIVAASNATAGEKQAALESGGSICDGTADQTEINTAITTANAAGGGTVRLTSGTYVPAATITGLSNVTLELNPGTVINLSTWGDPAIGISVLGTLGAFVNLNDNAALGDNNVNVANTSTFSAYDATHSGLVFVASNAVWRSNIVGGGQLQGELQIVQEIVANTELRFYLSSDSVYGGRLADAYTMANTAKVAPITPVQNFNVYGNGGKIKSTQGAAFDDAEGILVKYALNCNFRDIVFENVEGRAIEMWSSYDSTVEGCYVYGQTMSASSYGVELDYACQGITVRNNTFRGSRHAIAIGGGANPGIPRSILCEGNVAFDSREAAFDCHNVGEQISYINNYVYGGRYGISFHGYSGLIQGNSILGTTGVALYVYEDSGVGTDTIVVSGNTIKNSGQQSIYIRTANTIVENNSCLDNLSAYGIYVYEGEYSEVNHNIVRSTTGGIAIESLGVKVHGNRVRGTQTNGIYLYTGNTCDGSVIDGNDVSGATNSINLQDNDYVTISNNKLVGTTPITVVVNATLTNVFGNDTYGSTNDISDSGTNTRIANNIDKLGAWAWGDNVQ